MPSRKIVVVGSSNIDMSIRVSQIPKPGETVLGGNLSIAPGGKGANQAVAAIRAGGDVCFITRLGVDMFGDTLFEGLVREGVEARYILRDPEERTGTALIIVDEHGENSIAVAPGANDKLLPGDIDEKRNLIGGAGILLMQLEIPIETVAEAARIAKANGVSVILNPAPALSIPHQILNNVSIITPNEKEAESLTGVQIQNEADAERAARILQERGCGAVVITLGPEGAFVSRAVSIRECCHRTASRRSIPRQPEMSSTARCRFHYRRAAVSSRLSDLRTPRLRSP